MFCSKMHSVCLHTTRKNRGSSPQPEKVGYGINHTVRTTEGVELNFKVHSFSSSSLRKDWKFSIPRVQRPYNSTRPWSQRRRRRERNAQRPITACHRPVQDMSRGLSQGGQDPWFVCVWVYVPHVARGAWQEPEAAESDGGERERAGQGRSDTV